MISETVMHRIICYVPASLIPFNKSATVTEGEDMGGEFATGATPMLIGSLILSNGLLPAGILNGLLRHVYQSGRCILTPLLSIIRDLYTRFSCFADSSKVSIAFLLFVAAFPRFPAFLLKYVAVINVASTLYFR